MLDTELTFKYSFINCNPITVHFVAPKDETNAKGYGISLYKIVRTVNFA